MFLLSFGKKVPQGTVEENMPTRAERERDKKAALLAAAEQVFSHSGYAQATLDDVIRVADTGKGTVYRYFGSKDNLFYALVLQKHRKLVDEFWAIARDEKKTVARKLRDIALAWIRFLADNLILWQVVQFEMTGMNRGIICVPRDDGSLELRVKWGELPPPERCEEIKRYHAMLLEEAEPMASVYGEGLRQGIFRATADHRDIAEHWFFGISKEVFMSPNPKYDFLGGTMTMDQLADNIAVHFLFGLVAPSKRQKIADELHRYIDF